MNTYSHSADYTEDKHPAGPGPTGGLNLTPGGILATCEFPNVRSVDWVDVRSLGGGVTFQTHHHGQEPLTCLRMFSWMWFRPGQSLIGWWWQTLCQLLWYRVTFVRLQMLIIVFTRMWQLLVAGSEDYNLEPGLHSTACSRPQKMVLSCERKAKPQQNTSV